jgi:hypothetical protein
MSDLSLFAYALGKVALSTGFIPAFLIFYAARIVARVLGWVPSPYTSGEKVVRDGNVKGASVEDFFSARSCSAENNPREVGVGSTRAVA